MPRIPTYKSNIQEMGIPSVGMQTPGGFAGPEAFGSMDARSRSSQGQQIERLGQAGSKMGLVMMQKENEEQEKFDNAESRKSEMVTHTDTRNFFRSQQENFRLGDAKDNGEGKSVYDTTEDFLGEHYRSVTKGMNKRQKELYDPAYDRIRQTYLAKADSYVSSQVDEYKRQQVTSQIKYREEASIEFRDNPVEQALNQQENEADFRSQLKGAPKAYIDEQIQNSNDRIYNGSIAAFLRDGNTAQAWAYFKENSADMSVKIRQTTQTALEKASLNDYVTLYADKLELSGKNFNEMIELAKRATGAHVNNEDLQNGVVKLLTSRSKENKEKIKQFEDREFNIGHDTVRDMEGGTPEEKYRNSVEWIDLNYTGKVRSTLHNLAKSIHKDGGVTTDTEVWDKLTTMKKNDPKAFMNVNLLKEQLSTADYKSFFTAQQDLKAGKVKVSEGSIISDALHEIGIFANKKDPELYKTASVFKTEAQLRIDSWRDEHKKEPSLETVREIIRKVQVETLTKGLEETGETLNKGFLWTDADRSYKEAEEKGTEAYWVPDIEDADAKRFFKAMIEEDGVYESSDEMVRIYARKGMGISLTSELKRIAKKYKK
jgi:hypothetical protein